MKINEQHGKCLNCEATVLDDFEYCAKCSQRVRESKITVRQLIGEFISGFFNFDSRFYQTCKHVLIPGKLTQEFIKGRRKKYINPARFFLFGLLIFFTAITYISKDLEIDLNQATELNKTVFQSELMARYDSVVTQLKFDSTAELDSLKRRLFDKYRGPSDDSIDFSNVISFSMEDDSLNIEKYHKGDVLNMDEDEFLNHYEIEGFQKRFLIKQTLRVYRNPSGTLTFFIGNLLWAVVLTVILLSLVMKFLYIRKKHYFVEHLILLLHVHGFVFLLGALFILFTTIFDYTNEVIIWSSVAIYTLYFIIAFKNYYKQGYFKTFFKFFIFVVCYNLIIAIFASIILLISILIF